MTKITSLPLAAIIASMLIALAPGTALAKDKVSPMDVEEVGDLVEKLLNLIEPKTIFVTSETYTGNLVLEANTRLGTAFSNSEGLEAGDALCQDLADSSFVLTPGEYVALLSSSEIAASARLTPSSGPIIRSDGVYVVQSTSALFATNNLGIQPNNLINGVSRDEAGQPIGSLLHVWTGSSFKGTPGLACMDWSADQGSGDTGSELTIGAEWLKRPSPVSCGESHRLYCVQR